MSTLVCPHCGIANRTGSNFCNKCGTDLRTEEEVPTEPTHPALAAAAERAAEQLAAEPPKPVEAADPADVDVGSTAAEDAEAAAADSIDPDAEPSTADSDQESIPPLFDLGLASPFNRNSARSAREASQLQGRFSTEVHGLLAPIALIEAPTDEEEGGAVALQPAPLFDLDDDQVRRIRTLMAEEPVLVGQPAITAPPGQPSLRIPWLFWLLGLGVALPLFFLPDRPPGAPHLWSGVDPVYSTLQRLPQDSEILLFWAYDAATAGEMDLVAQPVMAHLLKKRARMTVVSLSPTGPAIARRLLFKTLRPGASASEARIVTQRLLQETHYLPGGASVLPLVGQARLNTPLYDAAAFEPTSYAMAIVFAAHAEEVQQWLEMVQVLQQIPVAAVTGAAADPVLRPYLESGQLLGIVSGFDGAYAYRQLDGQALTSVDTQALSRHILGQNWAHIILLLALVLGNLSSVLLRAGRR